MWGCVCCFFCVFDASRVVVLTVCLENYGNGSLDWWVLEFRI